VVGGGCAPIGRPRLQGCWSHTLLHSLHSTPPSSTLARSHLAPARAAVWRLLTGGEGRCPLRPATPGLNGRSRRARCRTPLHSLHPTCPLPSSPSLLLPVCWE
jgi:hypothetical protein